MMRRYLSEHAKNAVLSLELARKKHKYLERTQLRLFAHKIDLKFIQSLEDDSAKSEMVEAFVSRFCRLQDYIGDKLMPRFMALVGAEVKSLLDNLSYAEKIGWLENAEQFLAARKIRNLLVHEYLNDEQNFLSALKELEGAAKILADILLRIENYANEIELC
jgi:hypothetical protein